MLGSDTDPQRRLVPATVIAQPSYSQTNLNAIASVLLSNAMAAVRVWSTESFELGKDGQAPQRYGVSVYDDDAGDDPVQRADQMIFRGKVWEIRPILNWEPGAYHEVVATL